jgi:hypothetical protein
MNVRISRSSSGQVQTIFSVDAAHRLASRMVRLRHRQRRLEMLKITALTMLAGLTMVATILPSNAQFIAAQPKKPAAASSHDCANEMGHVRRLGVADIDSITDRSVWLYPVCEDLTAYGRNDYGTLFLDGNANVLREPIARNEVLMSALEAKGYDQFDVISVVFGAQNSVLLYVHQRDMN